MPYTRRIVHLSADMETEIGDLTARAVRGCWFELHRLGGCGAGELVLKDSFAVRRDVRVGEWIAFEYEPGNRWYLGRVQSRIAHSPARVQLRLEGMSAELGEIYPGGFGPLVADGLKPHRYSRTDLYYGDPDYLLETMDSVAHPGELVRYLMEDYVVPRSNILYSPDLVEEASPPALVMSVKFRGEESIRSILKDQALRSKNAVWGVGPDRTFFFQQQRSTVLATFRIGREILQLEESADLDNLANRVLLTGDYVYDQVSDDVRFYRWRGHYLQPESRTKYGDKRMRMWVPWIRNQADARDFMREFFRVYAEPTPRYVVDVVGGPDLPFPWLGQIRLETSTGAELATTQCESLRVEFDAAPRWRLLLGPGDPREQWPEPVQDERWEVAGPARRSGWGGEPIVLTPDSSSVSEAPPSSSSLSSEVSEASSLSTSRLTEDTQGSDSQSLSTLSDLSGSHSLPSDIVSEWPSEFLSESLIEPSGHDSDSLLLPRTSSQSSEQDSSSEVSSFTGESSGSLSQSASDSRTSDVDSEVSSASTGSSTDSDSETSSQTSSTEESGTHSDSDSDSGTSTTSDGTEFDSSSASDSCSASADGTSTAQTSDSSADSTSSFRSESSASNALSDSAGLTTSDTHRDGSSTASSHDSDSSSELSSGVASSASSDSEATSSSEDSDVDPPEDSDPIIDPEPSGVHSETSHSSHWSSSSEVSSESSSEETTGTDSSSWNPWNDGWL